MWKMFLSHLTSEKLFNNKVRKMRCRVYLLMHIQADAPVNEKEYRNSLYSMKLNDWS